MSVSEVWDNEPDDKGQLPPCQYFISMEQPTCDAPAPVGVLVVNDISKTVVDLCEEHFATYDRRLVASRRRKAAARRAAHTGK